LRAIGISNNLENVHVIGVSVNDLYGTRHYPSGGVGYHHHHHFRRYQLSTFVIVKVF